MSCRYQAALALILATSGIASNASAHMPYLVPAVFDVGPRSKVTLEASFTEDAFRPEIAMADAPFEETDPAGLTRRLVDPIRLADRTVIDAPLDQEGVYRLSSGQRLGRMNRMVKQSGEWKILAEDAAVPAGAEVAKVQSTILADVYVLRGKPGARGALAPRGMALEIHPLADPTAIGAGEPIALEILYRGKPLAGVTVSLFRERGFYDGRKSLGDKTTGADGRVSIDAPDAGRYLVLVRHRGAAPAGAAAPFYSYTTTLAFEAM